MPTIGPFEVYSVRTGTFRLDGGAMFGVVPKVMWDKVTDADDGNRIPLATRTLIAIDRSARRVILVDTGNGTKWSPESAARFTIAHDGTAIQRALAALNFTAHDVTDVLVTHLHFDHNGGLTEWEDDPGGPTKLCFPSAWHWIHEKQWAHAHQPTPKDRASFLPEDYDALESAGVLHFVRGDDPPPPFDGLRWLISHGHTPYQLHPWIGDGGSGLLWTGDIIPTIAHLRQPWVMAYDLHPVTTMEEKLDFATRAIKTHCLLALPHDPVHAAVFVDGRPERPVVAKAVELTV